MANCALLKTNNQNGWKKMNIVIYNVEMANVLHL